MTRKPAVHTVPNSKGGWSNKVEGRTQPVSNHQTKATAQQAGRAEAVKRGTEHVIHNMNGRISGKNSYGSDPCPPKDKN